jgi:hypothetical protein
MGGRCRGWLNPGATGLALLNTLEGRQTSREAGSGPVAFGRAPPGTRTARRREPGHGITSQPVHSVSEVQRKAMVGTRVRAPFVPNTPRITTFTRGKVAGGRAKPMWL